MVRKVNRISDCIGNDPNYRRELDELTVINLVALKMLSTEGKNGEIVVDFKNIDIDLSPDEIYQIIEKIGYKVEYDEITNLYTVSKVKKSRNIFDINIFIKELNNLLESEKFKKTHAESIDISNLSIDFDDILRIIKRSNHDCIFEDAKSVTIFYEEEKGVMSGKFFTLF